MASNSHRLSREQVHYGWDNSIEPALTVRPGDTIELETVDASGGQLTKDSTTADVAKVDFARVNPVTGPVFVDGAEPGDALKVTILRFQPSGWGWTANIPGFGLLADRFSQPALHVWEYDPGTMEPAVFKPGGRVPLQPFPGEIGCAPGEPGHPSPAAARALRAAHAGCTDGGWGAPGAGAQQWGGRRSPCRSGYPAPCSRSPTHT